MSYRFATMPTDTVLPAQAARVFFDGIFAEPRLSHPEGVAVGPDGWIWCGSENGEILRIAPDGSHAERSPRPAASRSASPSMETVRSSPATSSMRRSSG
jgi:streptogramin lyase